MAKQSKQPPKHRPLYALYAVLGLVVVIEGASLLTASGYVSLQGSVKQQDQEIVTTIPQPKVFVAEAGYAMQYPTSWGEPTKSTANGIDTVQFGKSVTVLRVPLVDKYFRTLSVDDAISKYLTGDVASKEQTKFNGMNATLVRYKNDANHYTIVVSPKLSSGKTAFVVQVQQSTNDPDAPMVNRSLQTLAFLRT